MSVEFIGRPWLTSYLRALSYSQAYRTTHSAPKCLRISLRIHHTAKSSH